MPLLELFPSDPLINKGYSIHKKPTWASLVQTPPSGREVTGRQQIYPLWEFELTYEVLRDQSQNAAVIAATSGFEELQTLSEFWLTCAGQYGTFIYEDTDDNSRTGQIIGVGDNVSTSFTMVRTWGTGDYAFAEPVGCVDVRVGATLNIYLDGVLLPQPGNWWIDTDLRTLVFAFVVYTGVVITADFGFFYRCRFIEDELDLDEFMYGRWTVKSLRFRSVLADPPLTTLELNPFTPVTIEDQDDDLTTPQDEPYELRMYADTPAFGAGIGNDYVTAQWTNVIEEGVNITGGIVSLPSSGSFLVRASMSWTLTFCPDPDIIGATVAIVVDGQDFETILGHTISAQSGNPEIQSARTQIAGPGVTVRTNFRATNIDGSWPPPTGGNIFPANPAYFIVEYWSEPA